MHAGADREFAERPLANTRKTAGLHSRLRAAALKLQMPNRTCVEAPRDVRTRAEVVGPDLHGCVEPGEDVKVGGDYRKALLSHDVRAQNQQARLSRAAEAARPDRTPYLADGPSY